MTTDSYDLEAANQESVADGILVRDLVAHPPNWDVRIGNKPCEEMIEAGQKHACL